jgi:hypothetical protein
MEHHLGFPLETIAIFAAVVIFSVWLDLRLHRDSEDISIPNAVAWSLFWISSPSPFISISSFIMARIRRTVPGRLHPGKIAVGGQPDGVRRNLCLIRDQGRFATPDSVLSEFWAQWFFACCSSLSAPACLD